MVKSSDKNLVIGLGVALGVAIIVVIVLLMRKPSPPRGGASTPSAPAVKSVPPQPPQPAAPQPQPTLVLFYGEGCVHCKVFKPKWDGFVPELESKGVKCIALEQKEHMDIMRKEGVAGLPTIKFYPHGFPGESVPYGGAHSKEGIFEFLQNGPPQ